MRPRRARLSPSYRHGRDSFRFSPYRLWPPSLYLHFHRCPRFVSGARGYEIARMIGGFGPELRIHQRLDCDRSEAVCAHQRGHLGLGPSAEERQAVMDLRVFLAAHLRSPVTFDQHQPSVGPQQPAPRIERGLRMWQRPNHMALDNQVMARRREGERLDVRLDETDGEPLRRSLGARPGQHRGRDVDTGYAMVLGGEEQREEAGAAADVEHVERYGAREIENQPAPWLRLRIGHEPGTGFLVEVGGPPVPMLAHQLFNVFTASMIVRHHAIHIDRRG